MDKDVAVWIIKDNNRLKKSDKEKDSYFKILKIENKKVEFRVSNHLTHLLNWKKRISKLYSSVNIAISFIHGEAILDKEECKTNMKMENWNLPPFEVLQFVYDCDTLHDRDLLYINLNIHKALISGKYDDPYKNDKTRHAKIYRIVPNKDPILVS
jgi:hypothetical protein